MTADMPDPVEVARKVAEQICEGVALFETERCRVRQAAEAGARAMQDAMAGREDGRADIIKGLRNAASGRADRLQQIAAIDAAIAFLSALEPAGAQEGAASPIAAMAATLQAVADEGVFAPDPLVQEGAGDQPPYPEGDVVGPCVCGSWPGGPCLKCEWRPATPAPDVPGLVERLRQEAHETKIGGPTWGDGSVMDEAADALEALQAEVRSVRISLDGWKHAAEIAEAQQSVAEAERDALKAEVERMKERNAEHEARFDAESSRADHYKAEVERKDKALREAGEAIAEYFRYLNGGEMRGSYDGKPEREGLRKAGYAVSRALSPAKAGG